MDVKELEKSNVLYDHRYVSIVHLRLRSNFLIIGETAWPGGKGAGLVILRFRV